MSDTLCICSTQRTTKYQAEKFIDYHLAVGFDLIIIFIDDQFDKNYQQYESEKRVILVKCDDEYWGVKKKENLSIEKRQNYNCEVALELARKENIDWILHIDVDEFFYIEKSKDAKAYFQNIDGNCMLLRFRALESIPDKYEYSDFLKEINYFRYRPVEHRNTVKLRPYDKALLFLSLIQFKLLSFLLKITPLRSCFKYGYFKAYFDGKGAARVTPETQKILLHSHKIDYKSETYGKIASQAYVLHYDAFSLEAWESKWNKRISGIGASERMHEDRNQQQLDYYACKNTSEKKELYKKIYFIPKNKKRVLELLGFVKRIDNVKNHDNEKS